MATRSTIAMEQPDGRVMQIYCHWDGYLDHNGRILQEHYKDRAKVYALMLLGDLSSLRENIGEAHDFDDNTDRDICTAYGRDRGENGVDAKVFKDFDDYVKNHQYEEYEYCFRTDDNWYVSKYGQPYQRLDVAIAEEEALEE